MMSIWVFDTTNRSRPVPNDKLVLQGVKRAGDEARALASINAVLKKAEKPVYKKATDWEEESIPTAPNAVKKSGSLTAKLAKIFVKSAFLNAPDEQAAVLFRKMELCGFGRSDWAKTIDIKSLSCCASRSI